MSYLQRLAKKQLIFPPKDIIYNVHYECLTGSVAYGVSNDTSDMDIYGFAFPRKDIIFPHLTGYIDGFGTPPNRFEQFQQHHIKDDRKEYDITIYNIVKFFNLCMDGNPNMIDCLFVPQDCVLTSTKIGELVRSNRKLFLSKKMYHKFKGYASSQLHKMNIKDPKGKRKETVDKYGYDVKFAYHVVRLIDEIDQILNSHTLDLRRDKERLKSIRNGEYSLEDIQKFFDSKEKYLEESYQKSTLPHEPREKEIKQLLINCLEEHYGTLNVVIEKDECPICRQIKDILR